VKDRVQPDLKAGPKEDYTYLLTYLPTYILFVL